MACGQLDRNTQSIGIEHGLQGRNGRWRMTEATINSGARTVAALCLQYSLGRPQWGVNVVGHNGVRFNGCQHRLQLAVLGTTVHH